MNQPMYKNPVFIGGILLLLIIVVSFIVYYYRKKSSDLSEPDPDPVPSPGPSPSPSPSVNMCAYQLVLSASNTCKTNSTIGIKWQWNSSSCKEQVGKYKVVFYSDKMPDKKFATYIDDKNALSAGANGLCTSFMDNSTITFEVMPLDNSNNPLFLQPATLRIRAEDFGNNCDNLSFTDAVPFWNYNKNLRDVSIRNTGGGNESSYEVLDPNNVKVYDSGKKYNTPWIMAIPDNYSIGVKCEGHVAGIDSYNVKNPEFMNQYAVQDSNGVSTAITQNSRYEKSGNCFSGRAF